MICSVISWTVLFPGEVMAEDGWATLKGRFAYDGAPPAAKYLDTAGKDSEVCAKHKIPDESFGRFGVKIANAVVLRVKRLRT
jgi:hypothetical protein